MDKKMLLNTKEVAQFLDINEKVVYNLVAEKGLPATKATGKWLFPRHLVEQWLENSTTNYPKTITRLPEYHGALLIIGSDDILLDRTISLFNRLYPEHIAVFGNVGSLGGVEALRRDLCHIATSHLLQENNQEYNFGFADQDVRGDLPVLVNLCKREQGLIVAEDNKNKISCIPDLSREGIKIANRPEGTGTRLLFDRELEKAGLNGAHLIGYNDEFRGHLDVAIEVLSGRVDAAPGIKPVADILGLNFIPLRWERYDLLISKKHFFEQGVQLFLGILNESGFKELAGNLEGYDISQCGKVLFPQPKEKVS